VVLGFNNKGGLSMAKRTVKISVSDDVYGLLEHIGIEDTQELPEEIMAQIIEEYHIEFLRERGIQVIDGQAQLDELKKNVVEQMENMDVLALLRLLDCAKAKSKGGYQND
jgi:hypothetical protein